MKNLDKLYKIDKEHAEAMYQIALERHQRNLKKFLKKRKLAAAAFILAILLLCPLIARADMLTIAQSQIGLGEIGGNNQGHYVQKYLNGKENLPWCAGFVSYCAQKSGNKIKYTLRAKDFLKLGKKVKNPKAGDLIVFSRQGGGGHIGIIEKVTKDKIITIEGNTGDFPSTVKRITYGRNNIKNFLGFVRIKQ